jgi:hypothetical protein
LSTIPRVRKGTGRSQKDRVLEEEWHARKTEGYQGKGFIVEDLAQL